MADFPPVPLTLEGASVLHQFFRFDWKAWRATAALERERIAIEFTEALRELAREGLDAPVRTALYSQLGHKGDLMLIHFRDSLEALNQVELDLAQEQLYDFLEPLHSYVSVVELGLYESTRKTYEAAAAKGFAAHSPEWNAEIAASLERGAEAMKPRLWPAVPDAKYLCFYPMDRKRGEAVNWYTVPFAERQRMMHEHGMIGRRYADQVRQPPSRGIRARTGCGSRAARGREFSSAACCRSQLKLTRALRTRPKFSVPHPFCFFLQKRWETSSYSYRVEIQFP